MHTDLKKFLKGLGLKKAQIDFFEKPDDRDEESEATVDTVLTEVKTSMNDVFTSKLGPEHSKPAVDAAIDLYKKGEKARIAKLAGLPHSRKVLDEMELDAVITESGEAIKKHETDDETTQKALADLDDWKGKFSTLQETHEALESSTETRVQAAKDEAQAEVTQFHIKALVGDVRDFTVDDAGVQTKREWARDSDKLAGHHYIMGLINTKYDVDKDGKILNKDGTKAVNFSDNNTYDNIREAYNFQFDALEYGKKSNGGKGGDGDKGGGGAAAGGSDKRSDNTQRMLDAAKASEQRDGRG